MKTVLNHVTNFYNKLKISRELEPHYTKADAKTEIDKILKDYSECKITFEDNLYSISNSYQVKSRYERQKICMIIERTGVQKRSCGNMASEWLFHNIVYDVLEPFPDIFGIGDMRKKAQSAYIDRIRDERDEVFAITRILEIWGCE